MLEQNNRSKRVIISSELETNFRNYELVRTFKDARSIGMDSISIIIIHEFKETDFDVGVFISDFYNSGIKTFVYISKNPSVTVKMAINGVSGYTYDDDFYLEDEDELDGLIDNLAQEEDESLADTSAAIVGDFIQSFARGDEKIKAPLYLEQVTEALNELSTTVNQKSYQITVMGESAIDIFSRASEIIRGISIQKNKLTQQLQDLERVQKGAMQVKPTFGNSLQFYPQINYMRTPVLLLIREFTPCMYLTTFLLMYNQYIHYSLHKRTKFIVIHKKSYCESMRYHGFNKITTETMNMKSLYTGDYLAINAPKKDVMNKVFEEGVDVFIIIDRMYENVPIINGRVKNLNAVTGVGDCKRFNLNDSETIVSNIPNEDERFFFGTRKIGNFPVDFDAQVAAYKQMFEGVFQKINRYIGF